MTSDGIKDSSNNNNNNSNLLSGIKVACIGGGQLGRMMALEAPRLNMEVFFLDAAGASCPAARVVPGHHVLQGSLQDAAKIQQLAQSADIVTVEIEHVNVQALIELESAGITVQPSSRVIALIQDKYEQKQHFQNCNIPLARFCKCSSRLDIQRAAETLGLPLMLKSRRGGYDGNGNAVLKHCDDIETALQELLGSTTTTANNATLDLYAEGWIDFFCEIAVMVVRSTTGETRSYVPTNAIQQDSVCRVVLAPAQGISAAVCKQAQSLAMQAIESLGEGATGVFGVEMFVTRSGDVLLNEVAPRPHNTGHYTQDACATSQFENHLRAICGMPLGSTDMVVEAAAMVNVLGAKSGSMEDTMKSSNAALSMPRASVHWYSKSCRAGRKMGHINLTGHSHGELDVYLKELLELEEIPVSCLPGGSLPTTPLVGVIMGSQSDLPTMNAAVEMLKKFGVPYEVDIVSAHRTPDKLMEYSRSSAGRGLRVIIAGAGGAAHLPGMVAAMTPLPVIGVPVKTSTLSGVDSLYSIVQMPRGVPVATVAIGNSMNAGLLAVRILSTSRPELRQQMAEYQTEMSEMVHDMSSKLLDLGSDAFLEQMENKNQSVNV
jgi:phosphoribosylaminoimidazole carboxylase